eukprot:scaffold3821_cov173-Amphora_coffeaeformis.AAC.4
MDELEAAGLLAGLHLNSMYPKDRTDLGCLTLLHSDHPNADNSFLCVLREILGNATYGSVISWLPEGKIWRIHDMIGFQALVLPLIPTFRKVDCQLDLFMAYTRMYGFQELSRGPNSVAFYNKAFFRELLSHPSVPLKEIYLPSSVPMTVAGNSGPKANLQAKTKIPFKPLPPPPFALPNQKKPSVAPMTVLSDATRYDASDTYYVDSVKGMNKVKLIRANKSADKPTETPAKAPVTADTPKPVQVMESQPPSKVKVVKANTGATKAKKPRKKWLPSLGPPESESLRLLAKAAPCSGTKTWHCENAELFSTVSAMKARVPL